MVHSSDVDLESYEIQNPDGYEGGLGGLTRRQFLKYLSLIHI